MSEDWSVDLQLLARWRDGDQRAGEQLYARHVDAVIRFFRNKVRADAQDLVQETFLRLVAARERIKDGQAMRAYILTIARHVLLEHTRERPRVHELDLNRDSFSAVFPGPITIATKREEHRLLLEGLRRIPIEHQLLLELYYWERLSAKQLALIMEVPASTMRSRVARARELLGQAIAALTDSPELLASTQTNLDDWAEQVRRKHLSSEG